MANNSDGKAKTKMQQFIECVDKAYEYFEKAAGVALSIAHEMQNHANDVRAYRDSVLGTVEAAGGDTTFPLESEMGKYIPLKHRTHDDAQTEGPKK